MDDELVEFLGPLTPFTEEVVTWTTGTMRLACYLTDGTPPRRYVTSARAVVTDGERVLMIQDPRGRHIIPGGRLESDESPEVALQREVLEETGWSLACFRPIGVLQCTQLGAVPEDSPYPYPDFLQAVYAGSPGEHQPELKAVNGYELGSEFVSIADARRMPLNAGQQVFLSAASGESLRIIEKVVAYITRDDHLLVFRHIDSDAGIQVPAGTLEPGESPDDGVIREAREETGLDSLSIRRFLGSRNYDMSPYGIAELHRRHYYHLECEGDAPSVWRHFETGGGTTKGIEFELYWVMLLDHVPELAAAQGDFLAELGESLRLG